jgi:hypothetical protein
MDDLSKRRAAKRSTGDVEAPTEAVTHEDGSAVAGGEAEHARQQIQELQAQMCAAFCERDR